MRSRLQDWNHGDRTGKEKRQESVLPFSWSMEGHVKQNVFEPIKSAQ